MTLLFACSFLLIQTAPQKSDTDSIHVIDRLFRDIYELRIERAAAKKQISAAYEFLRRYCAENKTPATDRGKWVFPVRGYRASAIGGTRGEGYRGARAYDFFSGNSHGGHPAHDVFIQDRDFDDLDDRTGKPVDVLSVSGGIVISVNPAWTPDSMDSKRLQSIRGGIYVWVYDPAGDGLFYYAHLRRATCILGQHLKPGDKLGEIGRTGKNAAPRRSPTHLHLMYLSFGKGRPVPEDIYEHLVRAGTHPAPQKEKRRD